MPQLVRDPGDEAVRDYTGLTDVALRTRREPAEGLYLAEGEKVLRRALAAGHRPRSLLLARRRLEELGALVGQLEDSGVPVLVAEPAVMQAVTGYDVHRGVLASMHRPVLPPVQELLAGARRVAVLEDVVDSTDVGTDVSSAVRPCRVAIFEDIVDHTNLGAAFRSAAALGIDAVFVTPRCADPLYRRSIRVSMGTVFQVPWTRMDPWPEGLGALRQEGFTVAALALSDNSITLDEFASQLPERLALVLGTEGQGLSQEALDAADVVVRIPMANGVDSLNVAAAGAVAFWVTR